MRRCTFEPCGGLGIGSSDSWRVILRSEATPRVILSERSERGSLFVRQLNSLGARAIPRSLRSLRMTRQAKGQDDPEGYLSARIDAPVISAGMTMFVAATSNRSRGADFGCRNKRHVIGSQSCPPK